MNHRNSRNALSRRSSLKGALAGLLCWFSLPTVAGTLVVNNRSPQADDRNPGTAEKPLKTIQAAAELAQPGDTILVRDKYSSARSRGRRCIWSIRTGGRSTSPATISDTRLTRSK